MSNRRFVESRRWLPAWYLVVLLTSVGLMATTCISYMELRPRIELGKLSDLNVFQDAADSLFHHNFGPDAQVNWDRYNYGSDSSGPDLLTLEVSGRLRHPPVALTAECVGQINSLGYWMIAIEFRRRANNLIILNKIDTRVHERISDACMRQMAEHSVIEPLKRIWQ